MGTFSEGIEVVETAAGLPLHLAWRGGRYTLAAEPLRWYRRRNWWDEETRAAPGTGAGLVDREIWRVQVRRDGGSRNAPLLTLDLVRYLPSGRWRVIKIHDALTETVEELEPGA
ncbi:MULTISPECIES: DUF6504 family protein [unclassified Arthrobacter]|uniref:DUF6504 family protein n=1 Tax=unclassified Arthrobacter TaxID=235627 RepID=UPI00159D3A88|nr:MULTISPECIES: DUF6504 family protein [unclassified Arthrobacter]MCQ9163836.1 DUF6504 family protein [Arthrobacter sp. STN4]NVM99988.1 hypothetical protein [Arthrobacter sp. SDTb3-6]